VPRHMAGAVRRRFTRTRALLAGGLVLGLGATMTLAAWTDSEYGSGTFTASRFDIQSRTPSAPTFTDHPTAASAVAIFSGVTGMSPSTSHYSYLDITTTADTTVGGTVVPSGAPALSGTLTTVLEYRAFATTTGTTCGAAAFGAAAANTYMAGSASTWVPVSTVPTAPTAAGVTALAANGGNVVRYCFDVRIAPSAALSFGSTTGTVTWLFTGTSAS
jgi:predicted ribosomally synthesized peptide with SipW-like signal peptide